MRKLFALTLTAALFAPAFARAEDKPAAEASAADKPADATPAPEGNPPGPDTGAVSTPEAENKATETKAAEGKPADAKAPAAAQVVEGAPLGNDNVHVHIVEKKPYTNAGRHELVLYPAVAQVNSKFTNHLGAAAMYSYHLFENLAFQVTPLFNYLNRESAFNEELINKGRQQAQAATALLLQYGGVAGMEVTPIYGKFAFYEGVLGQFTFVLNAGAGAGNTRIQLRPESPDCATGGSNCKEAAFGTTGPKFLGQVGAGFRVYLGSRAALRLEVRDLVYTARVDKINGCTFQDMENLDKGVAPQSTSCNKAEFKSEEERPLARKLLEETSSDVLNNVSFYGGFSFLF